VRLVVVRLDNQPLNLLQTFVRTAMICLVVPPLIFNRTTAACTTSPSAR
jgi:hypothetical protein